MKYLLLFAVLGVLWWVWQKRRAQPPSSARPSAPVESMLSCTHCGVLFPASEAIVVGQRTYCSPAHRQAAGD